MVGLVARERDIDGIDVSGTVDSSDFSGGGDVRSADLPDLRKRDRHRARARYHSREEVSAARVAEGGSATDKTRYRR